MKYYETLDVIKMKAVDAGFAYERSYNKDVTQILVVSDQVLGTQEIKPKTGKLKEGENKKQKGYDITIMSESDFLKMLLESTGEK